MNFTVILICSVSHTRRGKLPEYNLTDRMWSFTKIEVKARPEFLINCRQHNNQYDYLSKIISMIAYLLFIRI